MIGLDAPTLMACMPDCVQARAIIWAPCLDASMALYEINSPERAADFLAQIGHESLGLLFVKELWGPAQVPEQQTYERDFSQPWGPQLKRGDRNFKAYGLGNAMQGDGFRFRGRGPIQITGRGNYARARDELRKVLPPAEVPDFEVDPAALEKPKWGAYAAGNFWHRKDLNALSDGDDFVEITRRINGGQNGMADRLVRRARARRALGLR